MVPAHGRHFVNVYWINRQAVGIWFGGEERAWWGEKDNLKCCPLAIQRTEGEKEMGE